MKEVAWLEGHKESQIGLWYCYQVGFYRFILSVTLLKIFHINAKKAIVYFTR